LRRAPFSGGDDHRHAPLPGGHGKGSREARADVLNDSFRASDVLNESFMAPDVLNESFRTSVR
jgi:hypothetical protein